MLGTIINALAILMGGFLGGGGKNPVSAAAQGRIKGALGALLVAAGGLLVWRGVGGGWSLMLKQIGIAFLALILGRLAGRLLRLQKFSNRAGEFARKKMGAASPNSPARFGDGFVTSSLLFCIAPLATLGALAEGVNGFGWLLVIKAVMDGLASLSFGQMFGRGVMLAALPVVAWQGLVTLAGAALNQQWQLSHPGLIASLLIVTGLLCLHVAVVVFEVRKVELAEYLPSLAVGPLLSWWWLGA